MAKIVGLSGAQGAGKSTLLVELQSRGWVLDQFRVSRAVQAEFGWETLDKVLESVDGMIAFQNEVFRQKCNHDLALKCRGVHGIVLVERTFADILAYTGEWLHAFVLQGQISAEEASEFYSDYAHSCEVCQEEIYEGVLLLPLMKHVKFQDDPNRAKEDSAIRVFDKVRHFVQTKTPRLPNHTIQSLSVADRADEVETFLKGLQ